ncbi:hypothetical protein VPH49_22110 [Pseudomonas luteola]|uniref:hypothetical protein n=1 Tax=Pseudomonas luteola TaxID=47886 RepID=UPI003A897ABF
MIDPDQTEDNLIVTPNSTEGHIIRLLRGNPLMRAFVMTALEQYATEIQNKPEGFMGKEPGFIDEKAWRQCAARTKLMIQEHNL